METLKTLGILIIIVLVLLGIFRIIPSNREPKEEITASIKQLQEEKEALLETIREKEKKIEELSLKLAQRKKEGMIRKKEIDSFTDRKIIEELTRLGF